MIGLVKEKSDANTDTETETKKFLKVHPTLTGRWSLSRSTIYELMDSGKLRSVKIGGARRIPIDVVEEFEAELAANGSI